MDKWRGTTLYHVDCGAKVRLVNRKRTKHLPKDFTATRSKQT